MEEALPEDLSEIEGVAEIDEALPQFEACYPIDQRRGFVKPIDRKRLFDGGSKKPAGYLKNADLAD